MSAVEATGKTVEEALEKALIELGRSKDEVTYEVLEAPSRGFFGLFGGHEARLRVTEKEAQGVPAAPAMEMPVAPVEAPAAPVASAASPQERAESFLSGIFRSMGLTVAMERRETEEGVLYDLSGESLGILIGKHGQTLDALQYLTNLAANRVAEKACRIHAEVRLEPMNRHERKIIHMALQDNYRVSTYSDGDEPYRCVVIAPKRRRRPAPRDWDRERGEE